MKDIIMNLAEFEESDSNSSENKDSDGDIDDICVKEFKEVHNICQHLTYEGVYVLDVTATRSTNPSTAVALSNNSVKVYELNESFHESKTIPQSSDKTVELKFSRENDNLLWTGTNNGTITLWDLRTPGEAVSSFSDTTDDKIEKDKKFNTFDISSNGRLLCAGTDVFEGDSFLIFWDIRNSKLAGGFWETHTDDITKVIFHPNDSNRMFSGSTDGLINIYDLTQTSEDDALIDCLNTESSIEKLNVFEEGSGEIISCVTHTFDVQLWKSEGVLPYCNFSRGDICQSMLRKSKNYIYVVDVHKTKKSPFILAGSNVRKRQCVKGVNVEKSSLKPSFQLAQNQQNHQIIRCSWYNEDNNLLLTGGEQGFLNAWKLSGEYL